jgi:CrcB protein
VQTWLKALVLTVGGTLGVNSRYWLGVWMNRWTSPQFPWATVVINVSGSFAIGFLTVVLTRWLPHPNVRLLVITGFLGGYTTFSTFEQDALNLWERGERRLMAANLIGSVVVGLAAVYLGTILARAVVDRLGTPVSAFAGRAAVDVASHPISAGTPPGTERLSAAPGSPERMKLARGPLDGYPDDHPR